MSCENPTCERCEPPARTTVEEDEIAAAAVLDFVLNEHPDHFTPAELLVALRVDPRQGSGPEDDAIERALDELIANGLARISGALLVPTRPALCCARLLSHL